MRYKRKPEIIHAKEYTGDNVQELLDWIGQLNVKWEWRFKHPSKSIEVQGPDAEWRKLDPGDYVFVDLDGGQHVNSKRVFEGMWEPEEETPTA